ncbi:MAG: glycosyltransferase family 39 protein [Taibaiella sp.]|nr:glycosyltransferase family 39 protein [Taibaiella sp.]
MYASDKVAAPGIAKWYSNHKLLLFLIWVVLTAININKAFHIDDTFHLAVAKWLIQYPLTPMSGTVIWFEDPEPFSSASQPPLYFYLIAIWGRIFGFSEIMLHLMQSFFTFGCIFLFYRIIKLFNEKYALTFTVLFAFNPAFIVNQNLMTDVPLLFCLLSFIYTLINVRLGSDLKRFVSAAIILSVGLLIKYTLLPMVFVLVLAILYERKYWYLFVVLIPVLFLGLWSVWNYYEFGSVHLLNRGGRMSWENIVKKSESFILCMGAIFFLPVFLLHKFFPASRVLYALAITGSFSIPIFLVLVYFDVISEAKSTEIIGEVFLANGKFILITLLFSLYLHFNKTKVHLRQRVIVVYVWLVSIAMFVILFSPSVATRHILLLVPAILIILSIYWDKVTAQVRKIAIAGTFISGVLIGISDWQFADFYRRAALDVRKHAGTAGKIWCVGHWGWQWYCGLQDLEALSTHTSTVKKGDYIVMPTHISRQDTREIDLTEVKSYSYAPGIFSFISVSRFAGFYATSRNEIPWNLSKEPIDKIIIYRVNSNHPK